MHHSRSMSRPPQRLLVALLVVAILFVGLVAISFAQSDPTATDATFVSQDDLQVTIYVEGFTIVTDTRTFELSAGLNRVVFNDVHDNALNQRSVVLNSGPGVRLVRQSFEPMRRTVINNDTLLAENMGESITLTIFRDDSEQSVTGTLLEFNGSELLLRTPDAQVLRILRNEIRGYDLPNLIEPGASGPDLTLFVEAERAGEVPLAVSYLVSAGVTWSTDYALRTVEGSPNVDLNGWITIQNSGVRAFENARVTLAGGDVDAVQFVGRESTFGVAPTASAEPSASPPPGGYGGGGGFRGDVQTVPPGQRFRYELPGKITLAAQSPTIIDFLADVEIAAENVFVYDASPRVVGFTGFITDPDYGFNEQTVVQNYLEIGAGESGTLPIDLPGGPLTLYRTTAANTTETLGVSELPFTPQAVVLQIYLDNSVDITGSRTQSAFAELSPDAVQESVAITLSNSSDSPAQVTVPERMPRGANWEVLGSNVPFTALPNGAGVAFVVEVGPGETVSISYEVAYRR